ncbi:MAG: internal scaffolding protein [Microviridae sp.]|nr:MAG: internal scaffolding protein [Microviridae sp.]
MSYNKDIPRPITKTDSLPLSNYSPKKRYGMHFAPDSPYTKQEFKDECDINVIMAQYQSTGQIPILNEVAPQYLDCSDFDFRASMEYIAEAKSLFMEMPSRIRNRFDNDPASFLEFCSQEKNRPEMVEMGLLKPQSEWVQTSIPGTELPAPQVPKNEAPAE